MEKHRIHFKLTDGTEDYVELEGTLEDIIEQAGIEVTKRGGLEPWSEEIK